MATNTLAVAALTVKLALPAFSDFAERAELELPLPITEARITKSFVSKTQPAVMIIVDDRHQFNWRSLVNDKDTGMKAQLLMGRIYYYDHSNSVSRLQGKPVLLQALAKKQSLITTNQAREIALNFLKRNGYDLSQAKTKVGPPWVRQATYRLEDSLEPTMPLPAYSIIFVKKGVKKPEWNHVLMEIEVSGLTKRITRFESSPFIYKAVSVDLKRFQP